MRSLFVFALLFYGVSSEAMSEKQLKAATKLIRNVCQPKNKVTNDQINAVHKGDFTNDRAVSCYMECSLRMGKITKNGKFDMQNVIDLAATLPESRQQASIESARSCKDAATSTDKCEAASEIYKCLYLFNPENFFLP